MESVPGPARLSLRPRLGPPQRQSMWSPGRAEAQRIRFVKGLIHPRKL